MLSIIKTDKGLLEVNEELLNYCLAHSPSSISRQVIEALSCTAKTYVERSSKIDSITLLRKLVAESLGKASNTNTSMRHDFYVLTRYNNENVCKRAESNMEVDMSDFIGKVYIKVGDYVYNWYDPRVRVLSDHFLYYYSCKEGCLFFLGEECLEEDGLIYLKGFRLYDVSETLNSIKPR